MKQRKVFMKRKLKLLTDSNNTLTGALMYCLSVIDSTGPLANPTDVVAINQLKKLLGLPQDTANTKELL